MMWRESLSETVQVQEEQDLSGIWMDLSAW